MKNLEEYVGEKYGSYTILEVFRKSDYKHTCLVQCKCGTVFETKLYYAVNHTADGCNYCNHGVPFTAYIGKKYGKLLVTDYYYENEKVHCVVKCDCGNITEIKPSDLLNGKKQSCGKCKKLVVVYNSIERAQKRKETLLNNFLKKNLGKKYDRLTIIGAEMTKRHLTAICQCECGVIKSVNFYDIQSGKTTSCGCKHREILSQNAIIYSKNNHHKYDWYFLQNSEKCYCRSGYEVLYANYLIENNIEFKYEPDILETFNGLHYTPDFKILKDNQYVEIKGHIFSQAQQDKISYLVQKGYNIKQMF